MTALDFPGLLGLLSFSVGEYVSVGHEVIGTSPWHTAVMDPVDAPDYVDQLPDKADVFFGVCDPVVRAVGRPRRLRWEVRDPRRRPHNHRRPDRHRRHPTVGDRRDRARTAPVLAAGRRVDHQR